MKKLYLVALLTLLIFLHHTQYACAQAPGIASFSPLKGPVDTTVTINGTNFNPQASGNMVFFGTIAANVISATSSQLTVKVPAGASYQPISILNTQNNLQCVSAIPFVTTFSPSKHIISANDFDNLVEIGVNYQHSTPVFANIDGDGKPDMVLASGPYGTFSVYRNTSVPGGVTTNTFGTKVDFAAGPYPAALYVADIDGDGKPDIIVTQQYTNTISIYRNTSTTGVVSFATAINVTFNNTVGSINIADVDGDGKPDLIVTDNYSTVSVIQNTTVNHAISFNNAVSILSLTTYESINVADLDGDGKPDLLVSDNNGNINIYHNTAISGSISASSYTLGLNLTATGNSGPLYIGDLDGDGKPDILINNTNSQLSILRNTATKGTINAATFAPEISILVTSIFSYLAIGDVNGDGIPDIVACSNYDSVIFLFQNFNVPGQINSSSFLGGTNLTDFNGVGPISIVDIDGDGRQDIVTGDNYSSSLSIFRNDPAYAPVITSFSPINGPVGTTVSIRGQHFGTAIANNIVHFGAVAAVVDSVSANKLVVTVPVGTNYQPVSVLNNVKQLSGNSKIPFISTFTSQSPNFNPKFPVATTSKPYAIANVDIDGDGKPDMVVANAGSNTISVYQNLGGGNLSPATFATKVDFPTDSGPVAIAVGDLDGDGKPDLVVANYNSNTISIYQNVSSTGTISTYSLEGKVDLATNSHPTSVSIGDIDGDGRPDIAVANAGGNTISIFRNIFDASTGFSITAGAFAPRVDITTGANPAAVLIADLDGDNKPELISASYSSNTISVFRNITSSTSTGFFAPAVNFTTGSNPQFLAFGDLDNDGKPDIITANRGSNNISVFHNLSSVGVINTASLAPAVNFDAGTAPDAISISDINGDGRPDLIAANYGSNSITIFGNACPKGVINTSSFSLKVSVPVDVNPTSVSIEDMDSDGLPDILVSNFNSNTISVYRNNPVFLNPPVVTSVTPISAPVGATVIISGSNFNTAAINNTVFFGSTAAHLLSASANQIAVSVPTGSAFQTVSVLDANSGLTGYSPAIFITTFPTKNTITEGDFDNPVFFQPGSNPNIYTDSRAINIADVDGDGKPDLIVANNNDHTISVFGNSAVAGTVNSASFANKFNFTTGNGAVAIATGDLNGDGKPDVVAVNETDNTISVFQNTSAGPLSANSFAPRVNFAAGNGPVSVCIADIDGDGKPDVIVCNYSSGTISIFRNISTKGNQTPVLFAPRVDIPLTINQIPQKIAVKDMDGDGKPDIVIMASNGQLSNLSSIIILRNVCSRGDVSSFANGITIPLGITINAFCVGDIDGDGQPDLVVSDPNDLYVLQNLIQPGTAIPASPFGSVIKIATNVSPSSLTLADMDGDGKLDLVVSDNYYQAMSIYRNISVKGMVNSTSFGGALHFIITNDGTQTVYAAVGDLDGDGKPDMVCANSNNTIAILRNHPRPTPPAITSFTPMSGPPGTKITITGANFNASADSDIVYFGAIRGVVNSASATQLTVTVPVGATYQDIMVLNAKYGIAGTSEVPFVVSTPGKATFDKTDFSPKISFKTGKRPLQAKLADIDGDGKPDLIVLNQGDNTVAIYHNISKRGTVDSTSFASPVIFSTGNNPSSLVIMDVDGDGKPDIAFDNQNDGTFSVYRNTAVSGTISLSSLQSRVDFSVGTHCYLFTMGDIDGDGKPDVVITDDNGSTSLQNTSVPGVIDQNSFASKIDLNYPTNSTFLSDLNNDGKPDLCQPGYPNYDQISVMYNDTRGKMSIYSFAYPVTFAAAQFAAPFDVESADLDGDGRPDLVSLNNTSNSVSVFKNTAVNFSYSLGANVDFALNEIPLAASFADLNGDGQVDMAVLNNPTDPTISILQNIGTAGIINAGSFADKLNIAAGPGTNSLTIGDVDGDGLADLVVTDTTDNTVSVFRYNPVTAIPIITAVSPIDGPVGTTVNITGDNFNATAADNIVYFGATRAAVTSASTNALVVTSPAGATYQPVSVLNDASGLSGYYYTPFINTFTPGTPKAVARADFNTGTNPNSVQLSDIDGDGKPDMIVVNSGSNTVSVYRNISASGSITNGSFAPKVDFVTGNNSLSVKIEDIDGDGKPDMVVTNAGSNTISIYKNAAVSGVISTTSFSPKVDFNTGAFPNAVSIKDIDGDGRPDLIVTNYNAGTVSVYRNTTQTGVVNSNSFALPVNFATTSAPNNLAVGDLDNDGRPDIVVSNSTAGTISVYHNICIQGIINSSSFAQKVDFTTGTNPGQVAIGDLDDDGNPDLIVVDNSTANTISILKNITLTGVINASSFAAKVDLPVGQLPSSIAVADFSGDGKPDILVSNYNDGTLTVIPNESTSGSISSGSFPLKFTIPVGTNPSSVAIGDVDGDGLPDFIASNSGSNTISIYRNATQSAMGAPQITSFSPASGPVGTVVTINGNNFNNATQGNTVFFGATQATVSDATTTQLTVTVPTGAAYQPISVLNTGDNLTGYAGAPFVTTFPSLKPGFDAEVGFAGLPLTIAAADLDGDGKVDVATTTSGGAAIYIYKNTATKGVINASSLQPFFSIAAPQIPDWIKIEDIDGDGKPDIITSNYNTSTFTIYRNISTTGIFNASSFAPGVSFGSATSVGPVEIADIDGDGKPDILVINQPTNSIYIYKNISVKGSFTSSSLAAPIAIYTNTSYGNVVAMDLDGDGKPDLVAESGNNTVAVLHNTAIVGVIDQNSFDKPVNFITGTQPYYVAVGDIDGDGKPDILVSDLMSNTISAFRNTSVIGTINSSSFASKVDFQPGLGPIAIRIVDINGDGKPDILSVNQNDNTASILGNNSTPGNISFVQEVDIDNTGPRDFIAADIDGDGKPDLLLASQNYFVYVLRNDPTEPASMSAKMDSVLAASLKHPINSIGNVANNITMYPNPASASTTIKYNLPVQSDIVINIYNKGGKLMTSYKMTGRQPGVNESFLDTSSLSMGVYIVRLNAKSYNQTGKLIIKP